MEQVEAGASENVQKPLLKDADRDKILHLHKEALATVNSQHRKVLNSDQLASVKGIYAELECGDSHLEVYFFSVSGTLDGELFKGALFAGEIMMVHAKTVEQAKHLANDGLKSTIEALHQEVYTRGVRNDDGDGIIIDTAGNKLKSGREVRLQEPLVHMLKDKIGKARKKH